MRTAALYVLAAARIGNRQPVELASGDDASGRYVAADKFSDFARWEPPAVPKCDAMVSECCEEGQPSCGYAAALRQVCIATATWRKVGLKDVLDVCTGGSPDEHLCANITSAEIPTFQSCSMDVTDEAALHKCVQESCENDGSCGC